MLARKHRAPRHHAMGPLLFPLPVLAIVLAALDALLARWSQPWRSAGVELFFHAYFLWALFGLLVLLPARCTLRWMDAHSAPWPSRGYDARPWIVMLGWMVLPVMTEATLDEHTSLVGFVGLWEPRPWLELGGTLLGGILGLALLGRWLGGIPGALTASVGVALAFGIGYFSPAGSIAPPSADGPARPNLLLLVWDTCRADKLEPYGHERPTSPGLARLAEESLVFEDAISASTFTFTSHLSLLTGVHPTTHGAHLRRMRFDSERGASLAMLLKQAGYRTGAFVGTDVLAGRTGIREGFDVYDDRVDPAVCDTFAWGFVHAIQTLAARAMPVLRFNGRPHWIEDFQRPADEVLTRARAWIARDDPRPWFCMINLYDVHWPYLPEGPESRRLVRPYSGPVDGFLFRSNRWQAGYEMGEADKRYVGDLYEGEILDLDTRVARFLDGLDLDEGGTAVLVTSDHGEGLGDERSDRSGVWNHDDVTEPQVRVPLILRLPEPNPRAERLGIPASGVDVAPTLLSLAGLDVPSGMEGRDLLGEAPQGERERWVEDRDHLSSEDYRCALYRGAFKLVRFGSGPDCRYELYDLEREPAGVTDVRTLHRQVFSELVARMEQRGAGAPLESMDSDDSNSLDGLQALGYAGDE